MSRINGLRAALAAIVGAVAMAPAQADYTEHPRARAFIERMASEHGFDRQRLKRFLATAERQESILEAMRRPAESKPWHEYRPIFLTEDRIRRGVAFWREHEELLGRVAEEYGVAPEVIVAILGVETRYGAYTGRYPILDSLATLSFDYPPRADFFTSELEHFLLLTREEQVDPREAMGSYAGAMGMPQFISSSYRSYAVDFDDDGRRDLWTSEADVMGSVANYFARHGWQAGAPVAAPARLTGAEPGTASRRPQKATGTVGAFREQGVEVDAAIPDDQPAALLRLQADDGPRYWLTFPNFYVISRYNHSALYSMAVHQLSQAIREAHDRDRGAGR